MTLDEAKEKFLTNDFTLKKDFEQLDHERSSILTRAEKYAGWTLPSVFPLNEINDNDEIQYDFQSVGAGAVTNLANKVMMALFQPSRPFFRMNLTEKQKAEIKAATGLDEPAMEKAIAKAERAATERLNKKHGRVTLTEAIILLIITGNALLALPKNEKLSVYTLRDYVVTRDLRGGLVKLIIREQKKLAALSDDLQATALGLGITDPHVQMELYTCAQRVGKDKYIVWQELNDIAYAHKAVGMYSESNLPWLPLTWNLAKKQDYGNGLVENYAGDFHTISTLAETILDFTAAATDIKNLVNPAGATDVDEIAQAASGDYVNGVEGDIFSYSPDVKFQADFLTNRFKDTERRIAVAFLMNSVVTRDAERVTAEEIRMQAQELEGSLGGVYSRMAVDLQQPLATYLMSEEQELFKDVEPTIVTGLESLSRMSDVDRLRAFVQDAIAFADLPEEMAIRLKYGGVLQRLSAGHGVDTDGILATEKEVEAEKARQAEANANTAGQEADAVAQATGQR